VTIQNLLIAALQNLRKLLSAVKRKPRRASFMEFLPIRSVISEDLLALMVVSTSILQMPSNLNRFLMNDEIKIEKRLLFSAVRQQPRKALRCLEGHVPLCNHPQSLRI
jgi:hypothetical protein